MSLSKEILPVMVPIRKKPLPISISLTDMVEDLNISHQEQSVGDNPFLPSITDVVWENPAIQQTDSETNLNGTTVAKRRQQRTHLSPTKKATMYAKIKTLRATGSLSHGSYICVN